ncbi:MAG: pyridoxal phosphate-dependent aminotransferase family protein [Candidatus Protochlamydia sp.]|nr:pyridoxal phosphate-dependent aminotransferase family protein [Candidatus Protochlamydia sp.]
MFAFEKKLAVRRKEGNLRRMPGVRNGIDFASNDYLGLARSATLKRAIEMEISRHSHLLGSTGSRLLTGDTPYAEELENQIAAFHGYEAGLLFNCGYMANAGIFSAVSGSNDALFYDAHLHASAKEGIRLSLARSFPFRHNDPIHLESRLKNCCLSGKRFICIESVYSTDGSLAPLSLYYSLAKKFDAHLIVDEAHAVGTFGTHGQGLASPADTFAQITTFGKALGAFGAIVLGSSLLKEALINLAHSFIYTTALPFHSLAAIKCSYVLFPKLDVARFHIFNLAKNFFGSKVPIQAFGISGSEAVKEASRKLNDKGFDVRPLTSPTVQKGRELLRVCLHNFNTENEVASLINALEKLNA